MQFEISDLMQSVLYQKKIGNMSQEEFFIFQAHQVAEHTEWYRPFSYPEIPFALMSYCKQRLEGQSVRSPEHHKMLVGFIARVNEIQAENDQQTSILKWALEKLNTVSLGTSQQKLSQFIAFRTVPNFPVMDAMVRVLQLDSRDGAKS